MTSTSSPASGGRGYSNQGLFKIGNGWQGYTPFGVADWDRDGLQDIVARHDPSGNLMLFPGEGGRGYSQPPAATTIGNGYEGYTPFGVADFDRDGHQDLIVRQDSTGKLMCPLRPEPSWLQHQRHGPDRYGFNGYTSFGVADWDRDGHSRPPHPSATAPRICSSIPGFSRRGYGDGTMRPDRQRLVAGRSAFKAPGGTGALR